MYSVADQVLEESVTPALISAAPNEDKASFAPQIPALRGGARQKGNNFNFPQGANLYSNRKSSLPTTLPVQAPPKSKVIYENERYGAATAAFQQEPAAHGSGLAELAGGRAELYLMQRRLIESLAKQKGWSAGWAAITSSKDLEEVDLESNESPYQEEESPYQDGDNDPMSRASRTDDQAGAVLCSGLAFSLMSITSFQTAFEVSFHSRRPSKVLKLNPASK